MRAQSQQGSVNPSPTSEASTSEDDDDDDDSIPDLVEEFNGFEARMQSQYTYANTESSSKASTHEIDDDSIPDLIEEFDNIDLAKSSAPDPVLPPKLEATISRTSEERKTAFAKGNNVSNGRERPSTRRRETVKWGSKAQSSQAEPSFMKRSASGTLNDAMVVSASSFLFPTVPSVKANSEHVRGILNENTGGSTSQEQTHLREPEIDTAEGKSTLMNPAEAHASPKTCYRCKKASCLLSTTSIYAIYLAAYREIYRAAYKKSDKSRDAVKKILSELEKIADGLCALSQELGQVEVETLNAKKESSVQGASESPGYQKKTSELTYRSAYRTSNDEPPNALAQLLAEFKTHIGLTDPLSREAGRDGKGMDDLLLQPVEGQHRRACKHAKKTGAQPEAFGNVKRVWNGGNRPYLDASQASATNSKESRRATTAWSHELGVQTRDGYPGVLYRLEESRMSRPVDGQVLRRHWVPLEYTRARNVDTGHDDSAWRALDPHL